MEIRRGAALEIPHIILLIDDEEDILLPALGERAKRAAPRYRSPLASGAGSVSGWTLDKEDDWALLAAGLEELARRSGSRCGRPFLYAAGDGNHSLAAAKAVWEEYKERCRGEPGLGEHAARWALVEVENLYDPGIGFEPIHRVLTGPRLEEVLGVLSRLPGFRARPIRAKDGTAGTGREELSRLVGDREAAENRLGLVSGGELTLVETGAPGLATDSLQPLLDAFIADRNTPGGGGNKNPVDIDYIHGEDELFRLAGPGSPERAVGILLPPIKKAGLFETVARSGPLPRKSISMGEAVEKRFYFECRKLF
jgi:hypothetical protein